MSAQSFLCSKDIYGGPSKSVLELVDDSYPVIGELVDDDPVIGELVHRVDCDFFSSCHLVFPSCSCIFPHVVVQVFG